MSKTKYTISSAIDMLSEVKERKFKETVEIAVKLNLNTKKPEHNFKDLCVLPHSLDKKSKILVVDDSLSNEEIKALDVDYCGGKEIIEQIKEGWVDFDVVLTTAKMMPMFSKLGKILGPRNLMPSPKLGTVVTDIKKAVAEFKKGKVSIKNDSFGNVHFVIGKRDFPKEKLIENFNFAIDLIKNKKPKTLKGKYIEKVFLTTTMGPSFSIDITTI
ncbi:50S ribosomal protein L1 [Candidatus Mycoplasma haematohominis]|uniref:Large ribosomal subunit protein uL1 n=1 Tax=Candidatus Mycoplasma haematohominis TaxID=1494318 RepID=A0A478FRP8_9MOLU|nr:50S ribosomal protein L1 [Candidatus Mycoplasma haemohominis]GCE63036.1 50S ribosomal protein L1 [Candidatus Mycoplasma haemohominis]